MPHSFVAIELHIIFHVKNHQSRLKTDDLPRIHSYIGGIVRMLGSTVITIGGVEDHVHLFCTLPTMKSPGDFVKEIKRVSSVWIKGLDESYRNFSWQTGYGAFSVSPSIKEKVIHYINNQREHHRTHTFREEFEAFLKAYGMEYDERYAVRNIDKQD